MLFGLSLGLVVAFGVYLSGSRSLSRPRAAAPVAETAVSPPPPAASGQEPRDESSATRFDFYEILPRYEVVVPEVEAPAGRGAVVGPVTEAGRYVLQVGSFRSLADADRLQASLALLGVESRIQRVTIDDDVFHRVRVGPISDLDELNRIRRQLRDARIETLLMKVN